MRLALAGIMLLLLAATSALGQASGFVETVGFGESTGIYRSTCWTPMLVYLLSEIDQPADYLIEVRQEDLDGDTVLYRKRITLSGNTAGTAAQPRMFWMYFIPRPTTKYKGLPQSDFAEQQKALRVYLCTTDGKQIKPLPLQKGYLDLDPYKSPYNSQRGTRLVLLLSDRNNKAVDLGEYGGAAGVMEDVRFQQVHPDRLPENPIAYEAVDAILWLDCDPAQPLIADKLPAIRAWVRGGGKLIICQRELWEPTSKVFGGDMLPVVFPRVGSDAAHVRQGMFSRSSLDPLASLAGFPQDGGQGWWRRGEYRMARAQVPPGSDSFVEEWIDWDDGLEPARTPYLARRPYGLGSVTWIAQDLSDPIFRDSRWDLPGWSKIWDRVFGWNNQTIPSPRRDDSAAIREDNQRERQAYAEASGIDLGGSFVRQMEHQGTVSLLVLISLAFFVIYVVLAGPVSYFVLRRRKQAHLSWFVFGASALVATGLTMGVVRLMLSGGAQVKHVTLIRQSPGTITSMESRVGLYIPQDGMREVLVEDDPARSGSARDGSYITPFPIHPAHLEAENEAGGEYPLAVREMTSDTPLSAEFPFRRSLKKLKIDWTTEGAARPALFGGTATLRRAGPGRRLEGTLTNTTGRRLAGVYLIYTLGGVGNDYMIYVPTWDAGAALDLSQCATFPPTAQWDGRSDRPARGPIGTTDGSRKTDLGSWAKVFIDRLRAWSFDRDDSNNGERACPTAFPVVSVFDRLPVMRNPDPQEGMPGGAQRQELLRRGVRRWDMSAAVGAGGLVILAAADGKMAVPLPVRVDGDAPSADGTIFYQVVLPLSREP